MKSVIDELSPMPALQGSADSTWVLKEQDI